LMILLMILGERSECSAIEPANGAIVIVLIYEYDAFRE
jgi:hypothetical protein